MSQAHCQREERSVEHAEAGVTVVEEGAGVAGAGVEAGMVTMHRTLKSLNSLLLLVSTSFL